MGDVAYDFATTVVAALVLTGIAWLILCFVTWQWIDPFDWTGRAAFIVAIACVHFNQRGRP